MKTHESYVTSFSYLSGDSESLEDFTRIDSQWDPSLPDGDPQIPNKTLEYYVLNVEEDCAEHCLKETRFICRHFHVNYLTKVCEWAEYGYYFRANPAKYVHHTRGDLFMRKCRYTVHTYYIYSINT